MLVKDEVDIIGFTVERLLGQVDQVIVADNLSTDGTPTVLNTLAAEYGDRLLVGTDYEAAHYQGRKTTELAMQALALGHQWVIPNDADEFWYAPDGRTLSAALGALAGDVMVVRARLYDHLPTSEDPISADPFARIGFRKRDHAKLRKVACRLRPDLEILDGNHGASFSGTGLAIEDLVVRHFTWRSPEQYVRKIANGARAFAETDLPEGVGAHWRMHGDPDVEGFEERVRAHFFEWFWSVRPYADDTLIYDPVRDLDGKDRY